MYSQEGQACGARPPELKPCAVRDGGQGLILRSPSPASARKYVCVLELSYLGVTWYCMFYGPAGNCTLGTSVGANITFRTKGTDHKFLF